METLLGLIEDSKIESGYTILPNGFVDNGWLVKAPAIATPVLMGLALTISKRMQKNDIIRYLYEHYSDDTRFNFFVPRHKFKDKNEQLDFWENRQRETEIRLSLENAGYQYPENVEDMLALFIKWGIVIEKNEQLDLAISPFPIPETFGID
ncbi:hypothetical protein H1230_16730 [Paenibacillus sp. 19GGS1-52]|uniref:DUF6042 family protein n=1 Tax=Paenibacillus sp. 19GGS1-52 TaxID=2758563 RepID=UPI001EFB4A83|nr:DUF6042 family protein [Paenibacillus sp. 19GGS1-52]ULO04796.1 hypothetical protein H1230_16730 [Paenibacillus sp. 19GGS1-52]